MKIVEVDGISVNGVGEIRVGIDNDSTRGMRARIELQSRNRQSPHIRSVQKEARSLTLKVSPSDPQFQGDTYLAQFEMLVGRLFEPARDLIEFVAERVPGDPSTLMSCWGMVQRLDPSQRNRYPFTVEAIVPDEQWTALVPVVETTTPFSVGGNASARPTISLTSTAVGSRYRVTVTDRTSQGVGGWMNAIAWEHPAAETWLWINGLPMPFVVHDGSLWFRTDINANQPTYVDVYHIPDSDNTRYADRLESSGTHLSAGLAAKTTVVADIGTAGKNPTSSLLTWHPGTTVAHSNSLPYTFGLSQQNQITLIDREASGQRQNLADDFDAFIFTSPVEISQMSSLQVKVASGIRQPDEVVSGDTESGGASDPKDFSRSISQQADRPAFLAIRMGGYAFGPVTEEVNERDDGFSWQSNFRDFSDFGGSWTYGGDEGHIYYHELIDSWLEYDVETEQDIRYWQFETSISKETILEGLQDVVTPGGVEDVDGGFLVTFPEGSFGGARLPFIGFSHNGDIPIIVDQAWVTANGNVITSDEQGEAGAGAAAKPKNGRIKVVLRYRVRDDETWYTAWSKTINGNSSASDQTVTIPARSFPNGAVEIAVGLEPIANGKTSIDWGVLTVSANPTLTFMAGKTPLVDVSDAIDAMKIDGALHVDSNGDGSIEYRISCDGIFVDTALILDCDTLWVDTSTQPVYNRPLFTDSDRWCRLEPVEDVAWATTGNIDTVEFEFLERRTI